ncbi:ACP S-malonyltransferase [Colwellia sp. MB02u-18]|uniref:ACP S-malonyltransferase n=1 Tax=unclassified Colwellia TaxID=196834 RepID=UPI0015F3AB76|nr:MULTISPECIES: ACP S-malonyltransferase [unclassified Colwellia]MBA6224985.1 ACP S-malonyltransferase [Colwellia sp. MB3u-45]MBA6268727.1 ACP S-malonyltransferase [Colwellia sp. MB3u-43]MBA6321158.1 ACP S-malonyltransferase [Colwellia sp. MB02u-19]MBA6325711.1 ACP S-malonyltransferase [Colwellia sp. MB02u-18]MBA6332186.1 ACP S-malonyltransferase [Colwellia sp. MB02u-12]
MQNNLAFVFPGQGSQSLAMLADFAENEVVQNTFAEASAALGYNLWHLVQQGPVEKLNQTNFTQPALLTASVAIWRVWHANSSITPKLLAGHSLGEYSALVCAGVLSLADAVKLVEKRGEFMQASVPEGVGAMAAIIGLDDKIIIDACAKAANDEVVSAVNFNSPGQVVIAGHKAAVERAGILCKAAGAKRVLPLPVSVPSHCALMKDAAEKLAEEFNNVSFNEPTIPVVNNVDVATENSVEAIKIALIKQLYSPVRWTETIQYLAQQGIEIAIEAGPGKVLQGLLKRIDKTISCQSVNDSASLTKALESVE